MPASEFSDVFVSYRRKDVEFVKRLVEDLNKDGKEVWVDWEDIPPGAEGFADEIKRGLEGADTFIAVLSPDYLESTYCVDLELGYAVQMNKKIIPIVYKKFDDYEIPQGVGHINWIYFTPHAGQENTYAESFPKILDVMKTDLEHVRNHKRFLLRAIQWDENDRERSFLLIGSEIENVQDWMTNAIGKEPIPTKLHKDYITISIKNRQHQQCLLLSGVSVALVISIGLSILSLILFNNADIAKAQAIANEALAVKAEATAQRQAKEAESIALISNAQLIHSDDPPLALALAQEAVSIDNPPILVQRAYADIAYQPSLVLQHEISGSKRVFAVQYSDDGQFVIALTVSNTIGYISNLWQDLSLLEVDAWNATTNEPMILTKDETEAYKVQLLGTIFGEKELERFNEINDLVGQTLTYTLEMGVSMFSPDGRYLALGSYLEFVPDEEIMIVDTIFDQPEITRKTVPVGVTSIAFTPDSKWVAFGFADGSLSLFVSSTTKAFASFHTGTSRPITNMAFSPDGRYLALIFENITFDSSTQMLEIWNIMYGAEIFRSEFHLNSVKPLIHPDNQMVYFERGMYDIEKTANFDVLDLKTSTLTPYLDVTEQLLSKNVRDSNWEHSLEIVDNTIELHEIATNEILQTFVGHGEGLLYTVRFMSDGKSAISYACGESIDYRCTGEIIIWDLATGDIKYKRTGLPNFQSGYAFTITPDNTQLVYTSVDDNYQYLTVFMDMETGDIIQELPVGGNEIYFLSDTEMLITPSHFSPDTDTSLWNYNTGELLRYYAGKSAIFTPENKLITADDTRVIIWDDTEQSRIITMLDEVSDLTLSNDGKTLVVTTQLGVGDLGVSANDIFVFRLDTLDEIQAWVADNRLIQELTCNERRAYRVTPYCQSNEEG
jgi:WD40 repeat protein